MFLLNYTTEYKSAEKTKIIQNTTVSGIHIHRTYNTTVSGIHIHCTYNTTTQKKRRPDETWYNRSTFSPLTRNINPTLNLTLKVCKKRTCI